MTIHNEFKRMYAEIDKLRTALSFCHESKGEVIRELQEEVDELKNSLEEEQGELEQALDEVDNLENYLEEIIETIYGRTDIDVGRDELVTYIRDLKDAELLLNEADSDTYNTLQRRYDEKFK